MKKLLCISFLINVFLLILTFTIETNANTNIVQGIKTKKENIINVEVEKNIITGKILSEDYLIKKIEDLTKINKEYSKTIVNIEKCNNFKSNSNVISSIDSMISEINPENVDVDVNLFPLLGVYGGEYGANILKDMLVYSEISSVRLEALYRIESGDAIDEINSIINNNKEGDSEILVEALLKAEEYDGMNSTQIFYDSIFDFVTNIESSDFLNKKEAVENAMIYLNLHSEKEFYDDISQHMKEKGIEFDS